MKTTIKILGIFVLALFIMTCPRFEICVGKCIDNVGNGKEYNGEPYYNYINYNGHGDIHKNDIVVTGFILDENGECEKRLFDKVILRNVK